MKSRYLLFLIIFNFCSSPENNQQPSQTVDLESPAAQNASLPYLIKGDDEELYMSWVEKGDANHASLKYSKLASSGWSASELIAEGNNWFINWADYPMIAIDNHGNKIAHYLAKSSSGTYSYDINVVTKKADSIHWSLPLPPHTDNTPTEHGFVTMLPNNNSTFTLAWLDGRNTGGMTDHSDHSGAGAMSIRTAVIDLAGNLSNEVELDARVCDCCQTSGAMTSKGPIFVYRDRSVDEVRDMAFVSKAEDWLAPKLVAEDNWSIAGCPVNGPRMDATENTVAVAWFTEALNRPKVKVAFKSGEDFDLPILIDDTSPVGRVDLVMISDQTAVVSWLDGGSKPTISYRMVNKNGSMSSVYTVAETSDERGSGFPQMELHNNWLYFAWTEMGEIDQIRLKKIKLN